MPFTLRPMEPRDVPVVAAIDRLSFPTPWPAAAFRSELTRERATYLVLVSHEQDDIEGPTESHEGWLQRLFCPKEDESVVGYVGFRLEKGGGHITTLALHPDWRGLGLGEYLLLTALERMAAHGVDVVTLEMRPSNDVAYRLYRKYDFQIAESRGEYYRDGEDAWVMTAKLGGRDYGPRQARVRRVLDEGVDS